MSTTFLEASRPIIKIDAHLWLLDAWFAPRGERHADVHIDGDEDNRPLNAVEFTVLGGKRGRYSVHASAVYKMPGVTSHLCTAPSCRREFTHGTRSSKAVFRNEIEEIKKQLTHKIGTYWAWYCELVDKVKVTA